MHVMEMEYSTWAIVNGPLIFFNFIISVFFICCMVQPPHGERIKQPLKLLLSSLIVSTVAYLMTTFGFYFSTLRDEDNVRLVRLISVGCLSTSIASCVWLNFFYCTQIVPGQSALFIWIKKNIKSFIFCIWPVEIFCSFLDFALVYLTFRLADISKFNGTSTVIHNFQFTPLHMRGAELKNLYVILNVIQRFHFYSCAAVMLMSSGTTVVYLARHMRHMVANGQSLSCSKLSSQVRVTAMGILQGLLYLYFALWCEYVFVSRHNNSANIGATVHLTAINLYMSGITFTLGLGQAVFRQRATQIWTRVAQSCKKPKVQKSERGI